MSVRAIQALTRPALRGTRRDGRRRRGVVVKADPTPAEVRDALLAEHPDAVETVRGWVAKMVFGAAWSLSDPDGVVQEITLRVLHLAREGRIRAGTDFKSFVLTVARHTCTDVYRRERLKDSIEAPAPATLDLKPAATGNPHESLERKEKREFLRFIFQELPEECRRLWRWVYGQGLPAAEVATRLGIREGTARVRVHRCLQTARAIHERYALATPSPGGANDHGA